MLSYLAGVRGNWERVNLGKHSTNVRQLLPPDATCYYDALMSSYVPADGAQILRALDMLRIW